MLGMQTRPKVIVVGHFPPAQGGIASLLQGVFDSGIQQTYQLLPFNISRPPKKKVNDNFGYGALFNAGLFRTATALAFTLWHMFAFPYTLIRQKPALVHIHTAAFLVFWETAYYVLVCSFLRIDCALQLHFSFRYFYERSGRWGRRGILWVLQQVRVFVVICREDVQFLFHKTSGSVRCEYLPNFIDVRGFQAMVQSARNSLLKVPGDTVVLFVGGTESIRKGVLDFLKAASMLDSARLKLRLLIAAVPRELVLANLAPDMHAHCEVVDWVSGASKAAVFAKADLFVLPSSAEGMPIAILESMAVGLPVIATRVGGIPDMITHGQEGLLINHGDVDGLAKAISQLAEDRSAMSTMSEGGLRRVHQLYDVSVGVQQLEDLYRRVMRNSDGQFAWSEFPPVRSSRPQKD
jgi:glycosyltransferase involved in cell wall biosynthesis